MSLESKPRVVRRHRRAASDDEYNPRQCRHSRPRSNLTMKDFMSPEAAPCKFVYNTLELLQNTCKTWRTKNYR